jgi:Tfp pilus assembly protein PilO
VSRRAPIVAAVGLVLLILLAVVFVVLPKNSEVGEVRDELDAAEAQESVLRAELARLQAAQENLPRIRRQLARVRRAVPPLADLPGVINQLQSIADTAGVDFFSIAPSEPVPAVGAPVTEIPAQIQVIGGFFPVDEFLFRLETLPRAAKVAGVTITEGPEQLPQINVQLDVRFWTSDEDAGPGAAPPPAPSPSPSPTASPSPSPSPSPTPSPGV